MKNCRLWCLTLFTVTVGVALPRMSCAQISPNPAAPVGLDPREIPVPWIKGPMGRLPGVTELPVRREMPDVLTMNDGTKVTTAAQWQKRREEIKRTLQYYATGQMPPPPGNVKGRALSSESVLGGKVKYRLVRLTFGPSEKLSLDIGIFTPAEGGPFPAIISQSGTPPGGVVLPRLSQGPGQGRGLDVLLPEDVIKSLVAAADAARGGASRGAPPSSAAVPGQTAAPDRGARGGSATAESLADRHAEVFRRGYALVVYNNNDCAEDTTLRMPDGSWAFRTTRFFPAYPGYDWGVLAGWAWGASRIADYLETDPAIDTTKLIITGASRAGKSAMIAAAFDERLMGAPVVTGGGGVGAYRFAGPRNSETLDVMEKKYPNWFSPNLHEFWGQREKLPFDQHWFLALCAPRPFLALEGITDTISLPEAVRQSILGAKPAYRLFNAEDRLGVNYAGHGHAFTAEDWTAIMDFADRHLRGKRIDRAFNRFPSERELDEALAASRTGPGVGVATQAAPATAATLRFGDPDDASAMHRAEIAKVAETWLARYNAGDAAGVTALYTEDGYYVSAHILARGHREIEQYWARGIAAGGHLDFVRPVDVYVEDNLGYLLGKYQATNAGVTVDGRVVIVTKRRDGQWQIAVHQTVVRDQPE